MRCKKEGEEECRQQRGVSGRAERVLTDWHDDLTSCVFLIFLRAPSASVWICRCVLFSSDTHTRRNRVTHTHLCTLAWAVRGEETERWQTLSSPVRPRDTHAFSLWRTHTRTHSRLPLTQCALFTHPVPSCPLSHSLPSVPIPTPSAHIHF